MVVLPVGLKANWSLNMSDGITGKIQRLTISFSVSLLRRGVTDIGRKSEKLAGLDTLGTGVTSALSQWGSGIKTHSLGGACIGDTGSELQLYVVVYCTHIELD